MKKRPKMVMSFSRLRTHVLSPSDAPLLLRVICHQKLNSEFAPVEFFSPHCAAALWQIKFSYHRSLEQRNSSIMYGLRSGIFSSPFLWLNLCMSLWFRCSRTAVQRQSSTKRWNEKAVWGDIEAQANSTPDWSTEHKCFPSFLNSSSLSRCWRKWRRGDGQSEPRYKRSDGRWGGGGSVRRKSAIWLACSSGSHCSSGWLKIHLDQPC